jgi:hypothetical protein
MVIESTSTHQPLDQVDQGIKRRTLLRSSLTASAGLAEVLMSKTPPLYAQEHELRLITFSHFVPASDEEL